MSYFAFDGPVFVTSGPGPSLAAHNADLEKHFETVFDDTVVVIVDTSTLNGRGAIESYVAARLNARGIFMNTAWDSFIDSVSDPAFGARAVWRQFLGGRHGSGPLGYLNALGVCVVTTAPNAQALASQTGLSAAFLARLVVLHELQHCVDADRGNFEEPGTMTATGPDRTAWDGEGARPDLWISGRELYADAAAILFLLREGESLDAIDGVARFRAQPVLSALAERRRPVWTHFTAPMLWAIAADVRAHRIDPPSLSDDDIHEFAARYRDRALAEAAQVSAPILRAAITDPTASPASILARARAPSSWLALTAEAPIAHAPTAPPADHAHIHSRGRYGPACTPVGTAAR